MHFFNKTIGLVAVLCAIPSAFAATARPGIVTANVGTASSRMPTMVVKTSGSTTTGSTTAAALLADKECIDAYTMCIKGADACGEGFEECTTKVLFHGKMPNCLSTLAQCSSAGVNSLFGTSNIAALASGEVKNGEITDYTYPTNGSVLGQMITAAAISNQYDTSTCVRRVTSCLRKDSVCGDDFELCTTNRDFRKQRVFCDSTLARCQSEGVIELLGSSNRTAEPTASSRIGEMITEGAALAAVNAVSTCYKVIDQCFIGSCAENPYKCYENSSQLLINIVDAINSGAEITTEMIDGVLNGSSSVRAYIKNSCLETIGSNKYCYATFIGNGKMPTNAQLRDEDNQEDIFDAAYDSRMNVGMRAKIADLVDKFDTRAKAKCTDTIKSCAMRVCGGGVGSACYASVFSIDGQNSINGKNTYDEIKTGCEAIVNTDMYCKYAAANPNSTGTYSYSYIDRDAFEDLFPEYEKKQDPIGVVAALNSALATNYNDAAIAQMRKSCENVAKGCIKSMCGSEYTNCYRNRTDIISGTYETETGLDKSMNKMGGVLDNNIVIGLCLDTVKNASSCEEHLAIQTAKKKSSDQNTSGWGANTSVRDAWLDANSTTAYEQKSEEVETGMCFPSDTKGGKCNTNDLAPCDTVDANGCVYDTKQKLGYLDYVLGNEAKTLLQQVMVDIEKEAQATYNAKLTKEQNMCLAANNAGGILSSRDIGSTFMWAKLKMTNKVPAGYNVNGLKSTQFEASNDLYGSFCRVRVTLQSDDKNIQEAMRNKAWTTAYFAVGDAFTCGSWIPESELDELANAAAEKSVEGMAADQKRVRTWTTILGALGGGAGGLALGESIRTGKTLGGLTTLGPDVQLNKAKTARQDCVRAANFVASESNPNVLYQRSGDVYTNARVVLGNTSEITNLQNSRNVLFTIMNTTCALSDVNCANTKTVNLSNAITNVANATSEVKALCESTDEKDAVENQPTRGWISALSTVTLGSAGALLVNKATRDIQNSELDAAQKAAYEDWMNKVGRHVTCYIGGDEAGNYGDVISTSLE